MAASGKSVYRVRQIVAHDVAVIAEVKDGEIFGGRMRETRDPRIILGGVDSFWLVSGEKKESKLAINREEVSLPAFVASISRTATSIRASSMFDLQKTANGSSEPGKLDAVSFSAATRLCVGYAATAGDGRDVLSELSKGTLEIPLETAVSAIKVGADDWLTSDFESSSSGRHRLRLPSLRSVPVSRLENRPETISLPHGLVVFVAQPKWSEPRAADLRPEEEVLHSVEGWISRLKSLVALPDGAGSMDASTLLRLIADRTVSDEEKSELAVLSGHLAGRSELSEILPSILGSAHEFREKLAAFEASEKTRLRTEIEGQLRREMEAESTRLATMRSELSECEMRLAAAAHREGLLKAETEKLDETLRQRIESAAGGMIEASVRETSIIREEVARLRDEMAQMAAPAVAPPIIEPAVAREQTKPEVTPVRLTASETQRQTTLKELAVATGLTAAQISTVLATSTQAVPVLVGNEASSAAIDIATAIAGEAAAVVFCDPTKVSLADLLIDEQSGLQAAINDCRNHPDTLGAVALCNLTSGPCEYWLPQIVEMRRVGRLPRNLAVIASAAADGSRISVPNAALRHLFPLLPSNTSRPGTAAFAGTWPVTTEPDQERMGEAVGMLVDRGLEGSSMQNAARAMARTPSWVNIPDLVEIFITHSEWLAAVTAGKDHQYNDYFRNIEG